jgi:radical SAM superfamily enzyme YgiQ (UPF0313 family)
MTIKKNIIIISAHLPCERIYRKTYDYLQPMIGLHIASQINRHRYDITIYNELSAGAFNVSVKKHYDIVFLSGLQKDFDRMRQLSFFFRKKGSTVIAGGSICTLYPEFAMNFFDVVCSGGVESVSRIMADYEKGKLKNYYQSHQHEINDARIDHSLLKKCGITTYAHLIEASRGCNYTCGFCTMPAEKARHSPYSYERITADILDSLDSAPFFSIKNFYPTLFFIDNHFSLNRASASRLCGFIKNEKRVKWWGALISQNDLADRNFISLMSGSKCRSIFTGLESIDELFLSANSKKQNLSNVADILHHIDMAQKDGTIISFGYLFDPRISTVEDMKTQFMKITESDILLFPCFFSFVSPLLGTKVFLESIKKRELLPNLRLRDLDGCTLAYRNVKSTFDAISSFARIIFEDVSGMVNRRDMLVKTFRYIVKYRISDITVMYTVYRHNIRPFTIYKTTGDYKKRSYIGGTDILDPHYYDYPEDITGSDYRKYFEPVMVTDENGEPADWLKKYI